MHGLIRALKRYEPLPSYLLSIVISAEIIYIFSELKFFQNVNPEDTRYFLSALAQVEGAIIAIYITMMLVGVQLTLKDYSEVVLDVYRKNREFWLVFISYVGSIVLMLTLLQNAGNLNPSPLRLVYLWGAFNLIILPLFIYDSFVLFDPKVLIDRFLEIYTIEGDTLWKIYRIASRSIQSQNVGAAAYILGKIREYIGNDFSNKIKIIAKEIEERRIGKPSLDEFELTLAFIEGLAHMLRSLALYTVDQFESNRISQNEATWILNMIEPIFRIIFADLVISLYPLYFIPETKKNLEHTLSQCLLELELIIERLQKAPQGIKDEGLRRFLNVLPYNFVRSLECAGYWHLVERAKRLQELTDEGKKDDSFIAI